MSKQTVKLPHVDPAVTDPRAAQYRKDIESRRPSTALPKYDTPVAGGPTPPIPHLDQPHQDGATMAQQATAQRRASTPGSIIEPEQPSGKPNILPMDLLPPEAMKDPSFMHGAGSMYAASQPELARKYGVVRNSKHLSPQALMARPTAPGMPGKGQISPGTIDDLKKLEELREKSLKAETGELAAEQQAADSAAGAAVNIGGGNPTGTGGGGGGGKQLDEFDLDTLHQMMVKDLINNPEQRKIVEERCKPMSLADLVVEGFISQVVPVVPGTFEPEFTSLTGDDDLNLKRLILEEAKSLKVDDRYLLDKYALMGLACSVKAINGKPFGDYRDKDGDFHEESFLKKFKKIIRLPLPMLATMGTHYFWFDIRVRKLFVAEKVKNG